MRSLIGIRSQVVNLVDAGSSPVAGTWQTEEHRSQGRTLNRVGAYFPGLNKYLSARTRRCCRGTHTTLPRWRHRFDPGTTLMVNKKYRGSGGSAGYPKLPRSGGNVNRGWGTVKGGGGGSKPPSGCGKKIFDSALVFLAVAVVATSVLVTALNHIFM